jgi:hypothetical protein
MSLVSVFVDAFKKAAGKKPEIDKKELLRSQGGSLGSTSQFRPSPESDTGPGIDSADPEEGGEIKAR